jgi:hypothetical protein
MDMAMLIINFMQAKPFLQSCQLWSYSGTSQYFMEPKWSLPCLQELFTDLYSEPDQSSQYHPFPPLCSILLLSTYVLDSLVVFLPSYMHSSSLPLPICVTCTAHLILLHVITLTIFGEEYKLLISCCQWLCVKLCYLYVHLLCKLVTISDDCPRNWLFLHQIKSIPN